MDKLDIRGIASLTRYAVSSGIVDLKQHTLSFAAVPSQDEANLRQSFWFIPKRRARSGVSSASSPSLPIESRTLG
jgi:hypothetical protein